MSDSHKLTKIPKTVVKAYVSMVIDTFVVVVSVVSKMSCNLLIPASVSAFNVEHHRLSG